MDRPVEKGGQMLTLFVLCTAQDTTRAPRPGEQNGVAYHFTSRDEFVDLVQRGGFIEHAEFSGNMYGTSVQAVQDVAKNNKKCILDIDTQVSACPEGTLISLLSFCFGQIRLFCPS